MYITRFEESWTVFAKTGDGVGCWVFVFVVMGHLWTFTLYGMEHFHPWDKGR